MLDDLLQYLQDQGVGTQQIDLFSFEMPVDVDDLICLNQYDGEAPELRAAVNYPRLQVRSRAKDPSVALAKAEQAAGILHGINQQQIGSSFFMLIAAMQEPSYLGKDDQGRHEYVQNFEIIKERS